MFCQEVIFCLLLLKPIFEALAEKRSVEKIYFVLALVCVSSVCILFNILRKEIALKGEKRPRISSYLADSGA